MIETFTLSPRVTLRCFRDSRFKQGAFSIQLVTPMTGENAAKNALLPAVLLRGTTRCPDLRAITRELDDLYGASLSPMVRRVGDYQTTGLYCGFMDDRFALPGDRVLQGIADFTREVLLCSPLKDGGFLPEYVEGEKVNLISTIESERNDKRAYAMGRLLETMCRGDSFGIPRLGKREQVEAITPKTLRAHYETILRESPLELFYVGSAPAEEAAEYFRRMLAGLSGERKPLPPQTGLTLGEGGDTVETMDLSQGNLCMGFYTPITNRDREFPAMQLLNTLYGAGMTSKLFRNVREKQSLCYSVSSGYYAAKGVMAVYAGIDPETEPAAREEIIRQLDACRAGDLTRSELTAARAALVSSLRAVHDSPGSIEGYYASGALSGLGLTPEEYMDALNRVTLSDVTAAANTLKLHTTFFLRGECQ